MKSPGSRPGELAAAIADALAVTAVAKVRRLWFSPAACWGSAEAGKPMGEGHSIDHEVSVSAAAASVRDAIATREGLLGWNASRVDGDGRLGSEWALSYEGAPDFRWRVDRDDASGVFWTCTHGPGDSVGTTVEYALGSMPDGRTRVSLKHGGWPHREGNFKKCNTLWGAMLFRLKDFVENGT